jgi:tRNA pseudouridine55 synthase
VDINILFANQTWRLPLSNERIDGWLVIDKPLGMTSRAVVDRAARWFPRGISIGHTGTLDPLATGVLVIAVGKATRLAEYVQDMVKTYSATFTLGATSATDDAEGPITSTPNAGDPGRATVEATLTSFIGTTQQRPPVFSAVRVAGKRAYKAARAGIAVTPNAKSVRIDRIDILEYQFPTLRVEVRCGKGTYIRSLARDLGTKLGCGGYASALRREAVGGFTTLEATSFDDQLPRLILLSRGIVGLPRTSLCHTDVKRLGLGQSIVAPDGSSVGPIACFDGEMNLVAIAAVQADQRLQPTKVFV